MLTPQKVSLAVNFCHENTHFINKLFNSLLGVCFIIILNANTQRILHFPFFLNLVFELLNLFSFSIKLKHPSMHLYQAQYLPSSNFMPSFVHWSLKNNWWQVLSYCNRTRASQTNGKSWCKSYCRAWKRQIYKNIYFRTNWLL